MKNNLSAFVFAVAIILASVVFSYAFINRNQSSNTISVTGLGKTDFTSDLIVWEGSFEKQSTNLKTAFTELEKDKQIIKTYLLEKGLPEAAIIFQAVNTRENNRTLYSDDGRYIGQEFLGYVLSQTLKIESQEVEKVETISREITELLNKGVQLYSYPPRYYYTGLADLKIEMISRATEDARVRAETIAQNSGAGLGKLVEAKMGIFQITGQNSNEDYSWGGTYNTSDKNKTASITMKLTYGIR
jgi:hypothetical protein